MPGLTGIEITGILSPDKLQNSGYFINPCINDKKILYKALDTGIKGYVLKDDAVTDIAVAVDKVMQGGHFISEKLTGDAGR